MTATEDEGQARGADLLRRLADPRRPRLADPAALVVAHPDDETIGLGGQLDRFDDILVVVVTDGAPRRLSHAADNGFPDWQSYAAARRRELEAALGEVGIGAARLVTLGVPDQDAVRALSQITADLEGRLAGRVVVFTHAFEGGHPDHDAVALAVSRAAARLARSGRHAPLVVEMPYYREGGDGEWLIQSFRPDPTAPETAVPLPPDAAGRKRRMLDQHQTQRAVLARFGVDTERFRLQPGHDFSRPPNDGRRLYERLGWMSGTEWLRLAAEVLADDV